MIGKIKYLLLILILQIVVVIVLSQEGENNTLNRSSQALINIKNINDIDKINISDSHRHVLIKKKDGRWYLPGYQDLPANTDLLNDLLNKLKVIKTGWPVAKTKSASERFHVEENSHNRHLALFSSNDYQEDLFFGDSPGLHKIYVRKKSEDNIYDVKLGVNLLSVSEKDWLDKNLLQSHSEINSILGDDFELIIKSGAWALADLTSEEEMNAGEVDLLVSYLDKIQVKDVAKTENSVPDLSFTVVASGKKITYDFFKQENNHWVKSSLYAETFKIEPYFYENILKLQRRNFIK